MKNDLIIELAGSKIAGKLTGGLIYHTDLLWAHQVDTIITKPPSKHGIRCSS